MAHAGPGFWERLSMSWALVQKSWHVLKQDKELLLLPIIGAVISLIVFGIMLVAALSFLAAGEAGRIVGLFIVYGFIATIVGEFFNAALVAGALERFRGGDPTVRSSLGKAASRLSAVVGWGLLAATVGLVISAIRGRQQGGIMDVVRAMAAFALFAAWKLISFLVLPVIIAEDKGTVAALRRSFELVRKRWGEVIAGGVGIWIAGRLVMSAIFVVFFVANYLALTAFGFNLGITISLALFLIVAWLVAGLIFATLNQIFVAAVYLYAAKGTAKVFTKQEIKGILRTK
jgi:hypothetical protein